MGWESSTHPSSTRLQRKQRAFILARDPQCYLGYDGCTIVSTIEDHVIPLAQGGDRWSFSNRRGVCEPCHKVKTQAEAQAARAAVMAKAKRPAQQHPGLA